MRRIILGVGAQKAATTWLYSQISKDLAFSAPFAKEMHVLDLAFIDAFGAERKQVEDRARKGDAASSLQCDDPKSVHRFSMIENVERYFDYYDALIGEVEGLSSDITPSYAALPVDALRRVNAGFRSRSIEPRVVFVMREPVTRLESAAKMVVRKRGESQDAKKQVISLMETYAGTEQDLSRADYRRTATNLQRSFEQHQIFLGFYETLFHPSELQRLAEFLGMANHRFATEERDFASPFKLTYPVGFLEDLRAKYDDQYEFAGEVLGFDTSIWDDARRELYE